MQLGAVIKKRRAEKGLTQEAMARALGVTAPAVNKWEKGNSLPDITLLSPIARLLGVSLDELLSFREELTDQEIQDIIRQADEKFSTESYADAFAFAKAQAETYPNCEPLLHSLAAMAEAQIVLGKHPAEAEYDGFILRCYERLLQSGDETIRTAAADALFSRCMRREEYDEAETYLAWFSRQSPERKRKQALLYEKAGRRDEAYKAYEEILFSGCQMLGVVLNSLYIMKLREPDMAGARYYAEKSRELARLFEMGEYNARSAELELLLAERDRAGTLSCVQGLLENIGTLGAFTKAPLYSHMVFRDIQPDFIRKVKKDLLEGFRTGSEYAFMAGEPRWAELLDSAERCIS